MCRNYSYEDVRRALTRIFNNTVRDSIISRFVSRLGPLQIVKSFGKDDWAIIVALVGFMYE